MELDLQVPLGDEIFLNVAKELKNKKICLNNYTQAKYLINNNTNI